jgi:hypothetical protein
MLNSTTHRIFFKKTHNSSSHNRHYAPTRTTDFAYVFFCRTRTTRTGKCENILCLCDLLLGHVHRILVCIRLSHYTISQTETSSSHRPKNIPRQQQQKKQSKLCTTQESHSTCSGNSSRSTITKRVFTLQSAKP